MPRAHLYIQIELLLWLQDKEQKKSYFFLKSIISIEHHNYGVVLQQLKLYKVLWS